MAGNSPTTTDLGPRLSANTTKHGAGRDLTRARVDFTVPNAGVARGSDSGATAGADALELDGQLMVASRTSDSAELVVRSGNTIYRFTSDNADTI